MPTKLYSYRNCSTCKKAEKFLREQEVDHKLKDIIEQTPTRSELERAYRDNGKNLRKLFNTSGQVYRERGLKSQIATMSFDEAVQLLQSDGKLVKRPFLVTDEKILVGFKQEEWEQSL